MTKIHMKAILALVAGILIFPSPALAQTPDCGLSGTDKNCTILSAITLSKTTQTGYSPGINSAQGTWTLVVHVAGKVGTFGFNIKEYNHGASDICYHAGQNNIPPGLNFFTTSEIPAATVNACAASSNKFPDPDPQLYVYANIQTGDSKASVVIDVTYPNPNYVPPSAQLYGPSLHGPAVTALADRWAARRRTFSWNDGATR